jgi:hypothetical protein
MRVALALTLFSSVGLTPAKAFASDFTVAHPTYNPTTHNLAFDIVSPPSTQTDYYISLYNTVPLAIYTDNDTTQCNNFTHCDVTLDNLRMSVREGTNEPLGLTPS